MRRIVWPGLMLALVVGCSGRPGGAEGEDPKAIIEKAIKAQGGEEKLGQFRAGRWKGRGTLTLRGQEFPMTLETVYQLPDKYKTVMYVEVQGKKGEVIQVLEGDKGWMSADGKVLNLEGNLLKAFKEESYSANVELLVPLLKESRYTLSRLKETDVNGRPAVGVKVSAADHRDVELYFDKESFLPVKTIRPSLDVETMQEATIDVTYSDFKEFDGVKSPTMLVAHQGGKKLMEVQVAEYKKLDKLDPSEFVRPK